MVRTLTSALLFVAILLFAAPAFAQDGTAPPTDDAGRLVYKPSSRRERFPMDAGVRFWRATLEGDFQDEDENNKPATDIDVIDDLDLDENGIATELWFRIGFGGNTHNLTLSAFTTTREGESTLSRNITVDVLTYTAGSVVETEMTLGMASLDYEYRFIHPADDLHISELGLTASLKGFSVEAELEGALGNVDADVSAGFPAVGIRGRLPLGHPALSVNLSAQGGAFNASDVEFSYFEANGAVEWAFKNFVGGIGYRNLRVQAEAEDDDTEDSVDLRFDGFFIHAGFRF